MSNNEYPIISSTKQGLFMQNEYFNKQAASHDTTGYKILRRQQIVFSPQNLWMDNINYNDKFDIGIVSPSYKIYDIAPLYDSRYVGYMLKSNRAIKEYILASEQGASIVRRNLNMELFDKIQFPMPDLSLQQKYGKMLKLLDSSIHIHETFLARYLAMKAYLLQQLFI